MGIAETSVIVTGAIGALGLIVPLVRLRLESESQRQAERRALLNQVIDDCCNSLVRAEQKIPDLSDDLLPETLPDLARDFQGALYDANVDITRVAALLGPDNPVPVSLTVALKALNEVHKALLALHDGEQLTYPLAELREAFAYGSSAFLEAAAQERR